MNRCKNVGLNYKSYLSQAQSKDLRNKIDEYLDCKIVEWKQTVPHASHFDGEIVNKDYYIRNLIESIWRIRLMRVVDAKALFEMAKISPIAAQIWANYEMEEMLHDSLFEQDLLAQNISKEYILNTEPYFSTKLLVGFFSYLIDHEKVLGTIVYSYLVEYVNVKLESSKMESMKKSIGEDKIRGQIAHAVVDIKDDHPGEVWEIIRHLIQNEDDIESLYRYIDEWQQLLAMYFTELYEKTIIKK